ncbi:hypothetical protein MLD38_004712 [Melastoma candidum]|uniref:Uncharacterized protein n=1 Tax=Melastoma candidum TaxID=119954 RepID=A0ACB9SF55_9MYRT|nr:hypothetical protein MLD38_004712 [Melastoma candidum]
MRSERKEQMDIKLVFSSLSSECLCPNYLPDLLWEQSMSSNQGSFSFGRSSPGRVEMQGECHTKAAVEAYCGDLATVLAVATAAPLANNVSGLQLLLDDNATNSLSNAESLVPYNSIATPVLAATEITSTLTPSRPCWTSQQQDLINHHALCLSHLHSVAEEVASLRQENSELHAINCRLYLLVQSHRNNPSQPQGADDINYGDAAATVAGFDLANRYRRLCIAENEVEQDGNSNESPTSVMEGSDVDRMALPKSISVRSTGFLKGSNGPNQGEGNSAVALGKGHAKAGSSSNTGKQKLYLRGGKNEESPLELEVYNQGMFKTELCNKWQETGTCPYRDHCQFAHGIKELRPVIRHPRYKTEVCHMVLAGDLCPYGHRCHFRHALTEQEKVMGMTALQTRDRD